MGQRHDDSSPREVIPDDGIKLVLDALRDDPVGAAEFVEGLSKHFHHLTVDPTPPVVEAAARFVRGWMLSCLVANDPSWRAQVEEHDRRLAAGDVSPGVDSETLRTLLGR